MQPQRPLRNSTHFATVGYAGSCSRTRMREATGLGRRKGRTTLRKAGASALIGLAAALALVVQLLAVPYHQARAAGAYAPTVAEVAAALTATFGDASALCIESGDKDGPVPGGACDDQCPLCRFASQAAALVPPDAAALLVRLGGPILVLGAAPERGAISLAITQPNRARAPPLPV